MISVGSRIKIKQNISNCRDWVSDMDKYKGKVVIVTGKIYEGEFFIKEDGGLWTWYEEMIDEIL